jgi:hypothetical protein
MFGWREIRGEKRKGEEKGNFSYTPTTFPSTLPSSPFVPYISGFEVPINKLVDKIFSVNYKNLSQDLVE